MKRNNRAFPAISSLADLEQHARRKLPDVVFSYVSSGAETCATVRANRAAFEAWAFRTRVLADVSARTQRVELFGKTFDAPFGIAPMGGAALCCYKGELAFARAAAAANQVYLLSGASSVRLEEVRNEGRTTWFQAYIVPDRERISALAERVARAGYEVMVATVDNPVVAMRPRGLDITPSVVLDGILHPRWLFGTALYTLLRSGIPHHENYHAERGGPLVGKGGPFATGPANFRYRRDALSWDDLAWLRKSWQGKLLLKGVLSAQDARTARDMGLDGIVVSNHGGRQLDGAAATLRGLPEILDAVKDIPVMLDGGVRRGTDVLKALALGAKFVFVGRPFNYALAVGGEACVRHALKLVRDEIDRDLAMLGCRDLASFHPGLLIPA